MKDNNCVSSQKTALKKMINSSRLPWTPRAEAAIKQGQKQSQKEGLDLATNEHILYGIFAVKECLGAKILSNLGLTQSKFLQRYDKLQDTERVRSFEDVDKMIRFAYEQAISWGHTYIGTEHLLIGILIAEDGTGFSLLNELGIKIEKVREETRKLIVCRDENVKE